MEEEEIPTNIGGKISMTKIHADQEIHSEKKKLVKKLCKHVNKLFIILIVGTYSGNICVHPYIHVNISIKVEN